jgi:hypothetical protein
MQSHPAKMHVPIQLKKITHITTEVAFSTGFLASALVSGGCVTAGREEDPVEGSDVDAGEDAIVDVVRMDDAEAKAHAYHAPPTADAPMVMPLALEDAPTTPPPATAMAPARTPAKKPAAGKRRAIAVIELETPANDQTEQTADVVSRASKRAEADDRGERRVRAERKAKKHDPIDQSFVPTYGQSVITPMGGRPY